MLIKKPLSSYHPILYWVRVNQKRAFKRIEWLFSSKKYCKEYNTEPLSFRYIKHTSKLIRQLGDSDIQLQHNKVINLKIAAQHLNGILIPPQSYFSFCFLVGKPTKRRGFVEGMELSHGEARKGIGGGICQLSNMIHWMSLHSPLQVVERANHSFDPFPDSGRVLPFGSGAAIFYNYIDLVLFNPTDETFQLLFNVGEKQLEGELRCNREKSYKYHIYEKNHRFIHQSDTVFRENEIWQDILTRGHQPELVHSRCLYRNRVRVKYAVPAELVQNL